MSTENTPHLPEDFSGWWSLDGSWVETPNERRSGWSGMMRVRIGETLYYIKKQCNHLHHCWRHPLGWPTTSREYTNILRLTALGLRVPTPVFHGIRRSTQGLEGLLVTEELAGFSDLDAQENLDPAARRMLAAAVGQTAGIMHAAHWQHSCLYGKHVMVRWTDGEAEIALIDLEKLRRPFLPWRAARHDLDQLRRHQHLWNDEEWQVLLTAHADRTR